MFNCFENCMEASTKVLIGNIDTVATHSKVLQMYTNANQSLTEQWTTAPVCTLANPAEAWDEYTNPYVPTGDTYDPTGGGTTPPNYGTGLADPTKPYNPDTNPFVPAGCSYYPNGNGPNNTGYGDLADPTKPYNPTAPNQNLFVEPAGYEPTEDGSDSLDQINMVNGLNTTTDPTSMNNFLTVYGNGTYPTDSWSSAFGTTVLDQSQLNSTEDSGTASANLTLITSVNNLVSSSAQEEEGQGQNEAKTMNSVIQEDSNNQQTIADWLSPIQDIESSLAALSVR